MKHFGRNDWSNTLNEYHDNRVPDELFRIWQCHISVILIVVRRN